MQWEWNGTAVYKNLHFFFYKPSVSSLTVHPFYHSATSQIFIVRGRRLRRFFVFFFPPALHLSPCIEWCCVRADLADDMDGGFKNSPGCAPFPPRSSQRAAVSVSHLLRPDRCVTVSARAEDRRLASCPSCACASVLCVRWLAEGHRSGRLCKQDSVFFRACPPMLQWAARFWRTVV